MRDLIEIYKVFNHIDITLEEEYSCVTWKNYGKIVYDLDRLVKKKCQTL